MLGAEQRVGVLVAHSEVADVTAEQCLWGGFRSSPSDDVFGHLIPPTPPPHTQTHTPSPKRKSA